MPVPFEIASENVENYTKSQIQDENVRLGEARCENELKQTPIKKLRYKLELLKVRKMCTIQLDEQQALTYKYPEGKTRLDLHKVLREFFE